MEHYVIEIIQCSASSGYPTSKRNSLDQLTSYFISSILK
jgi:hypothetical protein